MKFYKIIILFFISIYFFVGCAKTQYGIITARSGLILRQFPRMESDQIEIMPRGSKVIILDTEGPNELLYKIPAKWYRISYNFKEGWAFGGFIKHLRSDLNNAYQADSVYFIEFYEYKNRDFEMTVNLCQAVGSLKGTFIKKDGILKCKVRKRDFSGFLGDTVTYFEFKIIDKESIVYTGNDIACGPSKNLVLYKFNQ
jgi:hypothetical protein